MDFLPYVKKTEELNNKWYFDETRNLAPKNKLLWELLNYQNESGDSARSRRSYIIASKKLRQVLQQKTEMAPIVFLTDLERNHMFHACSFVKTVMDFQFNYKEFYKELCTKPVYPLEFIFRLHLLGIMPLDIYLSEIQSQQDIVSDFCKSVVQLLSIKPLSPKFNQCIISGIYAYLLNKTFGSDLEGDEEIKKICYSILDTAIKEIMYPEVIHKEGSVPSLLLLWDNPNICDSTLKDFCIYAIKFISTYQPNIDASQAISEHHNWTCKNMGSGISRLYKKIFTFLDANDIISTFQEILSSNNSNWKLFLVVVSLSLTFWQNFFSQILVCADDLIAKAFEVIDESLFLRSVLIARHASLPEHCDSISAYTNWFQKHFGDSSSLANTALTFEFLIESLTKLVPYEPEQYLKMYIDRPVHIVDLCRVTYMDYISLVKTRLSELKPQCSPETVLKKMLACFEATGKIPSTVLEKSILQKYEYVHSFLPSLLTPRMLPNIPDTRMKFIEALKQMGKIPKEMYDKYETECKAEAEKSIHVEFMDIEVSEIGEQLIDLTMTFNFKIQDCSKDINSLKGYLCEFRQKLLTILKQVNRSNPEVPIDMVNCSVDDPVKEAIQDVVNCYCNFQTEASNLISQVSLLWDLAGDLQDLQNFHDVLYVIIWEKITSSEKETLKIGLSSLIFSITNFHVCYPKIKGNSSNSMLLYDFIIKELPLTTSDEISFFCRFSHLYFKLVFNQKPQLSSPPTLESLEPQVSPYHIKKFLYACTRLIPELRTNATHMSDSSSPLFDVYQMCKSQHFCHLFSSVKLTFHEWLLFESKIIPEKDNLCDNERVRYARWFMRNICTFETSFWYERLRLCCSELLKLLLTRYEKSPSFSKLFDILKNLVEIQLENRTTSSVPWCYEAIYSVATPRKNSDHHTLHINILLTRFFRLISELPSFILFKDFSVQLSPNITELESFINDWFRLYNNRELSLSSEITFHILKGLLSIVNDSTNFKLDDTQIREFFSRSPLFMLSVIEHWPVVKSKICHLLPQQKNYLCILLNEINLYFNWVNEMIFGNYISFSTKRELPDWVLGYIIFSRMKISSTQCSYSVFKDAGMEVIGAAIQFHLGSITSTEKQDIGLYLIKSIKWLIESEEVNLLDSFHYNNCIVKTVLSPAVWHHFSANCLWILLNLYDDVELQNLAVKYKSQWLALLLSNLSECKNSYAHRNGVNLYYYTLTTEEKPTRKSYGILNLNFIQDAVGKIKNILCVTSEECIQLISKDVIEKCDEYLKCFIPEKIATKKMKF